MRSNMQLSRLCICICIYRLTVHEPSVELSSRVAMRIWLLIREGVSPNLSRRRIFENHATVWLTGYQNAPPKVTDSALSAIHWNLGETCTILYIWYIMGTSLAIATYCIQYELVFVTMGVTRKSEETETETGDGDGEAVRAGERAAQSANGTVRCLPACHSVHSVSISVSGLQNASFCTLPMAHCRRCC